MRKKMINKFWQFRGYKFVLRFTVNLLILLITPENTAAQTNEVFNITLQIDEDSDLQNK